MQGNVTAIIRDRILFICALALYAVFSSPTPDIIGITELAILFMMVASLKIRFSSDKMPALVLAVYGVSVPVLVALSSGASMVEIIRDMVPFFFLLMPVLYVYRRQSDTRLLSWAVACIGVIFAMRTLISFGSEIFMPEAWQGSPPDLLYLANSPEVLFSCVFLAGTALMDQMNAWPRKILLLILAAIPLLAMAALMQRASLFYIAVLIFMGFVWLFWRRPRAAIFAAIIASIVLIPGYSFFGEIIRQLSFKTQMVGLNSRAEEWQAVYDQLSHSTFSFLFGMGWGAEFENPAVGGLRVNFTHSLISSLFLKTGLMGVIMFLCYGAGLLRLVWPQLRQDRLYLYALAGPLLIGLGLYASYKSLGYGLLLLILASLQSGKKLEIPRRSMP